MFSKRLDINTELNEISALYSKKKSNGEIIYDLTVSNPTILGFSYETKNILSSYIDERSLVYTPEPKGLLAAREVVAEYYHGKGKSIKAEDIFIVPSTSEAYSYLFKLFAEPGDDILIPQPCYPLFEFLAGMENCNTSYYPMLYDDKTGWSVDFELFEKNITERTKAIVIINPNNPAGSYINHFEYKKLNAISGKYGLPLIIDEVFSDYGIDRRADALETAAGEDSSLAFILNGFSKLLGLPQMKFGWIVVQGEDSKKDEAIKRLEIISDTYLSTATPVQYAAKTLLGMREKIQNEILARIKQNYEILNNEFHLNPDINVLKCEGGWSAIIKFANMDLPEEELVYRLLEKKNVLVHPGYYYDFADEGYAVVSLLTREEVFKEGLKRISGK